MIFFFCIHAERAENIFPLWAHAALFISSLATDAFELEANGNQTHYELQFTF